MATKVWLHPLSGVTRRREQSALVRDLLRVACEIEGYSLSESELSLPGLGLIELLERRESRGLSMSHCSGMLAVAIAPGRVGVDCESKGRHRDWAAIARQFFSPAEADTIAAAKPADTEVVFLRHWVLKEAYIKAIRGSIFGDLNAMVIGENGAHVASPDPCSAWNCWQMEVSETAIAVCSAGSSAVEVWLVDPDTSTLNGRVVERIPGRLSPSI